VFEAVIQTASRAFDIHLNSTSDAGLSRIEVITVRCRKPSALFFADVSGVEMTRTRTREPSWLSGEIATKESIFDWVSRFDVDRWYLSQSQEGAG
jgi:hypothetical protein